MKPNAANRYIDLIKQLQAADSERPIHWIQLIQLKLIKLFKTLCLSVLNSLF